MKPIWLRRLAWVAGVLLLLLLLTWQGIPALIKWQGPPRLSEAIGRPVTIGAVAFKPWALDLSVDDLAVGALQGAEPQLVVKRIHVDASIKSLFKLAPVIQALEVDAPRLRITRSAPGHYDIDDLLERFKPRPDEAKDNSEPARFAIFNVQVRDAALSFDDRPVQRVQRIDALQLALPFISNLPADVQVAVQPKLAFKLNGTAFDSGAQATPFAPVNQGTLHLRIAELDLAPYLGYLPASLPVKIERGKLHADLTVGFAVPADQAPSVSIKGNVGADDLAVADRQGQPLLAWQQARVELRDVQPLTRKIAVGNVRIQGARLQAARDAGGRINWMGLAEPAPAPARPPAKKADAPWQVSVEAAQLADATVRWNDATVQPAAALQLDGLALSAKPVRWPIAEPIALHVDGVLRSQADGAPALGRISAEGPVTDHDAKLDITVSQLGLSALAPYLAQALTPRVDGVLSAKARLDWSGSSQAPRLQLALESATVDALRVHSPDKADQSGKTPDALAWKQLALSDVRIDVLGRDVVLGAVKLAQPTVALSRDRKGRLNVEDWMASGDASPAPAATPKKPWRVSLKELTLDGGRVGLADAMAAADAREPLRVDIVLSKVGLRNFDWQGDRQSQTAQLQLSAQVGAPGRKARDAGTLDYNGHFGTTPLQASGKLRIERFPVHLFAPYIAARVQLALQRAEASYAGRVALRQLPAGLDVDASGDVKLTDVRVAALPGAAAKAGGDSDDELLNWQTLALTGVEIALKPKAKPKVTIASAALDDFYSRLVITEDGRFNLQEVVADEGAAQATGAPAAASAAPAVPAASAPAPASADADELPIDLTLGVTKLSSGKIDFTDHFIRPNYSAALTELNGQIGAFSSTSREMATIELRGRAAGTAQLEIGGALNPLVRPLALDIKAKATDLELAPLSPYAGKYAGYAIQRGKLSMDVAYKIDADGKLAAQNQIVLNQLTFGDKIESKDATKLPVLLAVALLKDRNGVIDINLPISGSVNDPKFSIGGLIWRVIVNLIGKALTAPFALLTGGGSDELSKIAFDPGRATFTSAGATALDKVAKALTDRPGLKMTVTGTADGKAEHDAFQRAVLDQRLRRLQKRGAEPADAPASAPQATALGADERKALIEKLYDATDLPNKPKNFLRLNKDIPPAQMEALLLEGIKVDADAMRQLALQRGVAVRDALIAKGLSNARLFLADPKLGAAGDAGATWTPHADLALSTK